MTILSKLIYRFSVIPNKISLSFFVFGGETGKFVKTEELIPQFAYKYAKDHNYPKQYWKRTEKFYATRY